MMKSVFALSLLLFWCQDPAFAFGNRRPSGPNATPSPTPTLRPSPTSQPTPAGQASFKKIFIVVLENTDADQALKQPFMKKLTVEGAYLSQFYAITHPSQPNYIAMTSGALHGVKSNSDVNLNVANIADLLERSGKTWKSYSDGYPGNCYKGSKTGRYVRKHQPFISYTGIQTQPRRCANIVSSDELEADIASGQLADYTLYVPDMDNDGHDTGVAFADKWLQSHFGSKLKDPKFIKDMLFVVTFDEGEKGGSNRIYTALYGEGVQPGTVSSQRYTLYSLLSTIEQRFELGNLGQNDASAPVIYGVWKN